MSYRVHEHLVSNCPFICFFQSFSLYTVSGLTQSSSFLFLQSNLKLLILEDQNSCQNQLGLVANNDPNIDHITDHIMKAYQTLSSLSYVVSGAHGPLVSSSVD